MHNWGKRSNAGSDRENTPGSRSVARWESKDKERGGSDRVKGKSFRSTRFERYTERELVVNCINCWAATC